MGPGSRRICFAARVVSLALAASSCATSRPRAAPAAIPADCWPFVTNPAPGPARVEPPLVDLSAAKPYRNYLGVTRVDPVADHFTFRSDLHGPTDIRVRRDGAGRLGIDLETSVCPRSILCSAGGGAAPSPADPPQPAEVAALAHDVEAELRSRCPSARGWSLKYQGRYRTVTAQELIASDVNDRGSRVVGWYGAADVELDESLTHFVRELCVYSGFFFTTEVHADADAQWLVLPPGETVFLGGAGTQRLAPRIAEAARRRDSKVPAPEFASLVPEGSPRLPPGLASRVTAKVALFDRGVRAGSDLLAHLDLHDAVFGTGAVADAAATLGQGHYKLHAALTSFVPLSPMAEWMVDAFAGTLALHLEDDHGHAWDRSYTVHGKIELEGSTVVAPNGLEIPREREKPPDPGLGPYGLDFVGETIHLTVDSELSNDPRL